MKLLQSEHLDEIAIVKGEVIYLESLKQAVVPPFIMLMPFIELPDFLSLEEQHPIQTEGVHGCIFELLVLEACCGDLNVGFKDMMSGEVTHRKRLFLVQGDH